MISDIEVIQLNLDDPALMARLLDVQRAAYRVEADLIGYADIPALHEDADDVRASGEIFGGAWLDGELAGVASYADEAEAGETTRTIGRMVVHPDFFRRGVASALLAWAEHDVPTPVRIVVTTGAANLPACTLYTRSGYRQTRLFTIPDGLQIAEFEKGVSSPAFHPTPDT